MHSRSPEERIRCPGARIVYGFKPPCEWWDWNTDHLQKLQQVPYLQSHLPSPYTIFYFLIVSPRDGAYYFTLKVERKETAQLHKLRMASKMPQLILVCCCYCFLSFPNTTLPTECLTECQKAGFTYMHQDMKIHCFEQNTVHDKDGAEESAAW